MTAPHTTDIGAVSVGGFLGFGSLVHRLADAAPWLASLSYIAAIVVAAVTVYYKIKTRK
jgi:hypothetical protein